MLVNYQRAGIAATSAYYLEADTGPEAPLSGPAFPSTRSGFINRADHDHDDIKLFCLSSENALSTGVLDTPFICCSASSYFYPPPSLSIPLLNFYRFYNTFLSLSVSFLLFSRNRFSVAIFGVDKMPGRVSNRLAREKGTWMEGEEGTWQNDTSRPPPLRYVRAIARPAPDKLLIPESWPLSPLNPDKERYLAPSGTKGAVPSGLDDDGGGGGDRPPSSPLAILVFFLPSCLYSLLPGHQLDFSSFFSLLVAGVLLLDTEKKKISLVLFFPFLFFSFFFSLRPWRRDSVYPPRLILAF